MKLKRYGVVYWNERLDHSIYAYCKAYDRIEAQIAFDGVTFDNYICGPLSRLYRRDWFEYPIKLEDVYRYVKR